MKYLIPIIALLLAACSRSNHDGLYVNHTEGEYAVTDRTLEVRDSVVTEHIGFQKIRNGNRLPKTHQTKQLFELHPVFEKDRLLLHQTIYQKIK